MSRKREIQVFSISFLDLLSGALGAVIILFISVPKAKGPQEAALKAQVQKLEAKIHQNVPGNSEKQEKEIVFLSAKVQELQEKNKALKDALANAQDKPEQRIPAGAPVDIGFKFKGKNIVLIIDVSGSMFNEDRIGQVKAGLKMLVTSMGPEYKIDVVYFPDGEAAEYRSLWRDLFPLEQNNKQEIYKFLQELQPYGSTPTRAVLSYALERYNEATDIVLLTDGAPTLSFSAKEDNIEDILSSIQQKNTQGIQINTIGVGSDFLEDTQNKKYIFLEKLSKQNSGFFVGF